MLENSLFVSEEFNFNLEEYHFLLLTPNNYRREYRGHSHGRCSGPQVTGFNTDQLQIDWG